MKTLDLHGQYHDKAALLVENFILLNETPLRIITGDSHMMRNLVIELANKYGFFFYNEGFVNYGSLIIVEERWYENITRKF